MSAPEEYPSVFATLSKIGSTHSPLGSLFCVATSTDSVPKKGNEIPFYMFHIKQKTDPAISRTCKSNEPSFYMLAFIYRYTALRLA